MTAKVCGGVYEGCTHTHTRIHTAIATAKSAGALPWTPDGCLLPLLRSRWGTADADKPTVARA